MAFSQAGTRMVFMLPTALNAVYNDTETILAEWSWDSRVFTTSRLYIYLNMITASYNSSKNSSSYRVRLAATDGTVSGTVACTANWTTGATFDRCVRGEGFVANPNAVVMVKMTIQMATGTSSTIAPIGYVAIHGWP